MAIKKQQTEKEYAISDIVIRLDTIIRLLIETNSDNDKFNKTNIIPVLNGLGLEPIDIAKIFGKGKATDISPYLYKKKEKTSKKNEETKP